MRVLIQHLSGLEIKQQMSLGVTLNKVIFSSFVLNKSETWHKKSEIFQ